MPLFHDRDIALQPDFVDRLFNALPSSYKTLSANQYIGYEHAQVDSVAAEGWQIRFNYDPHYCQYFGSHTSSWRVWLSDSLREALRSSQDFIVSTDGKAQARIKATDLLRDSLAIDVPAGLGNHVWMVSAVQ